MPNHTFEKLRFGIYSEKKLISNLWTAFSHKNDFYLGVRNIMGMVKVSLHGKDGTKYSHVALNKEYIEWMDENNFVRPDDRVFVKWQRATTPTKGAVHVASISFPTDWLKEKTSIPKLREPPLMITPAPPGKTLVLGIFYSFDKPNLLPLSLKKPDSLICHWPLDSGEFVTFFIELNLLISNLIFEEIKKIVFASLMMLKKLLKKKGPFL